MINKLNKTKMVFLGYLSNLTKAGIFKHAPYFAVLNITDSCCFKCIMCDQWKEKADGELSSEDWLDILSQLSKAGIAGVTFSGGEPFMRKDIIDIISGANKLGLEIAVITNGYLLNRDTIEGAVESGTKSFCISIDAAGERFDEIRGVKGAYQKVRDSCRLLSEYKKDGLDVYLYFTLMKATLNYYKEVYAIAEEFGFPFVVNLFDYTPYFFQGLKKRKDVFWIGPENLSLMKDFQQFIIEKKKKNPKSIYHTYSEIKYFSDYFRDPLQKGIPCIVSQQRINIDSRGNVYGGCWSMGSFGNLKDSPLRDIIDSARYRSAHKDMFFKRCPGCSCGYSKNLRYNLASLLREGSFRILPPIRQSIWR